MYFWNDIKLKSTDSNSSRPIFKSKLKHYLHDHDLMLSIIDANVMNTDLLVLDKIYKKIKIPVSVE